MTLGASVGAVRRTANGQVRATVRTSVRNAGTVVERGTLRWAIVDPRGRSVRTGSTAVGLDPGRAASAAPRATLGTARRLPAGRDRLVVRFVVAGRTLATTTVALRQRY